MKVLVIGGGGREHALCWAIARSGRVREVVCAPGNAGIATVARCSHVDLNDLRAMATLALSERPGLVVIGPEVPLALGLVDVLLRLGIRTFGPTRQAARLETSKAFAKAFMQRHEIPTAMHAVCSTIEEVEQELRAFTLPVVVKADGLAAGKGVVICHTRLEALAAAAQMFSGVLLGVQEHSVILEEFLTGPEISFFALCDGTTAVTLAAAQDHKRIGEGDTGPNTGGMGAYTTSSLLTPFMAEWLRSQIAQRAVDGMREEGAEFRGVLFCGIMMTVHGPMVLEFNTRFGDPETQAILLRLDSDIMDLLEAVVDGTADRLNIRLKPGASACIIAASGGYPGKYSSGKVISGLPALNDDPDAAIVFHSGTAYENGDPASNPVTAGGRVLGVAAASAASLEDALAKAYATLEHISFEGMQYRRDIGWRAKK